MSTVTPPTQQPSEGVTTKPADQPSMSDSIKSGITSSLSSPAAIAYIVFGIILLLIPAVGAAKLSHDKFGSIGWAILAFIFNPFYYLYYAYFVSTRQPIIQQPILGGRRRR